MFNTTTQHRKKLSFLTLIDIAILTIIFFGEAIFNSTYGFLELTTNNQVAPDTLVFDDTMNLMGIAKESIILVIAFIYLDFRKFNFRKFNLKIRRNFLLKTLMYFVIAGTVASSYEYLQMWLFPSLYPALQSGSEQVYSFSEHFSQFSPSLLAFSLLNGFFEELYFLGIIFAVQRKYLPFALMFSLLIRFSFHTYQGIGGALVITTLGISFSLLRLKYDDLPAFMLAHSFFDILGLGLPLYLLDLE